MRAIVSGLLLISGWAGTCLAEASAGRQEPLNAARIDELIRELASEDFPTRENATRLLKDNALDAEAQLNAAAKSLDPETQQRVAFVMENIERQKAQRAFLEAMKGPWVETLKEGRLTGPLLGVGKLNASPQPVNEETFGDPIGGEEAPRFLPRTQHFSGRWDSRALGAQWPADVEQTSLAVLSFLGAGHTEKVGQYKATVQNAVAWLKSRQREDGAILNEGWSQVDGVAHALALLALSEAAGMGKVPETIQAAQRAVDYAVSNHQTRTGADRGGFFRHVSSPPDLLTTTFFTMGLKSAKVSKLRVEATRFEGIIEFLDAMEQKEHLTFAFVRQGKPSARAAILGLVCRQLMGRKKDDLKDAVLIALEGLGIPTAADEKSDHLINYFGTLAAFQQGGEIWKNWNEALKKNLCETQIQAGPAERGWRPAGAWAGGGYILSTSLCIMSLEVYYRYLRLYR